MFFRKHHNTTSANIYLTEILRENWGKGRITFACPLDFKNVFVSVDHNILINKLKKNFGFSNSGCKLIANYLSDRMQSMKFNNSCSDIQKVELGVPQGSLLEPFLFNVFIKDLAANTKFVKNCFFADDYLMFHSCNKNDIDNCILEINYDFKNVFNWTVNNKLEIHPTKSKAIYFS